MFFINKIMNFCIRREIIHKNITRRIKKNYNSICILSKSDHNKNIPSFLFLFGFACGCFLLLLLGRLVQFFLFFSWISNQITYDHEHENRTKTLFQENLPFLTEMISSESWFSISSSIFSTFLINSKSSSFSICRTNSVSERIKSDTHSLSLCLSSSSGFSALSHLYHSLIHLSKIESVLGSFS